MDLQIDPVLPVPPESTDAWILRSSDKVNRMVPENMDAYHTDMTWVEVFVHCCVVMQCDTGFLINKLGRHLHNWI